MSVIKGQRLSTFSYESNLDKIQLEYNLEKQQDIKQCVNPVKYRPTLQKQEMNIKGNFNYTVSVIF